MIRNRIYYFLKPLLPPGLRLALRRQLVSQQRQNAERDGTWPILAGSQTPPAGWPGWPQGRRFALVLTHDVESRFGLDQTPALAQLLQRHGFRSAFNFIPRGRYSVDSKLRHRLLQDGFEIGVHDLHHDGQLYSSRKAFARKARMINSYLRDWDAVGFRSGFMLNRLDWLHDLRIAYDSSTFDTDPFEPQPHGCHTIFPFWVPQRGVAGSGVSPSGYVELPYTLPQDSTLFRLLNEREPDLWLRKLDWIAGHGGMALVNIHPDYIDFDGHSADGRLYPARLIDGFLSEILSRYGDACWNPLPRELAAWYRANALPQPRSTATADNATDLQGRRAAVLLYSHYPSDPRPRRAAEALVENGMTVDVVCLRENPSQPAIEVVRGVNVHRMPIRKSRASKWTYIRLYASFILACRRFLLERCDTRPYDLVHVHNMPDVLVFAASPARRRGARVLLDLHDPMPELMMAIYQLAWDSPFVRLLRCLERRSLAYAHVALTPNLAFQRLFIRRSCPETKMRIVMNSPEETIFTPPTPNPPPSGGNIFRIMHHGSIVHRHGVDLLVRALPFVRESVPDAELHIYGHRTPFLDEVLQIASGLGLTQAVVYHGAKTQREIASAILESHVGVIPNRHSEFTEMNLPTRIFEYLAMERPVLAPDTRGIRDYFDETQLFLFAPGEVRALADGLIAIHSRPDAAAARVAGGRRVLERHAWRHQKAVFVDVVGHALATSPISRS